jgi:hypothetical protein
LLYRNRTSLLTSAGVDRFIFPEKGNNKNWDIFRRLPAFRAVLLRRIFLKPRTQKYLDEHFEKGKSFLLAQEALLNELTETFETELWDNLEEQSLFRLGQKMAISSQPSLQDVLTRQILFTWGLGFAVGSTSTKESRRRLPGD